jgi:hypothetical protein
MAYNNMSGTQRSTQRLAVRNNLSIALGISDIKPLSQGLCFSTVLASSIIGQVAKSNPESNFHHVFVWQPMAQWDNGLTVSAIATGRNRQLCGIRKEQP